MNFEYIKTIFKDYFTVSFFMSVLSLIAVILIIYIFFKILIKWVMRFTTNKLSPEVQTLMTKILEYSCMVVILMTLFKHLGINISAFIGAAGIAGLAIGFAAQTSVSNVISGFFILAEKALKVGDRIQIGDIVGNVESIDFMAIRIKTIDGNVVRVPNESIIRGNLVNFSSYPVRRIETNISVSYGTDLQEAESILMQIPESIPQILQDPAPGVVWTEYADSGINISFYVWGKNEDFLTIKNSVFKMVNELFAEAEISIPFPQMDVYIKPENKDAN